MGGKVDDDEGMPHIHINRGRRPTVRKAPLAAIGNHAFDYYENDEATMNNLSMYRGNKSSVENHVAPIVNRELPIAADIVTAPVIPRVDTLAEPMPQIFQNIKQMSSQIQAEQMHFHFHFHGNEYIQKYDQ